MKIKGIEKRTVGRQSHHLFTHGDGDDAKEVHVMIEALPLGFEQDAQRRLPTPAPPVRFQKTGDGKVLRYPKGHPEAGKPVMGHDESDPAYQSAVLEHNILAAVLAFLTATKNDPDVSFSAKAPGADDAPEAWREYLRAVHDEMAAFGLTAVELMNASKAIQTQSGFSNEAVEALAVTDFS